MMHFARASSSYDKSLASPFLHSCLEWAFTYAYMYLLPIHTADRQTDGQTNGQDQLLNPTLHMCNIR